MMFEFEVSNTALATPEGKFFLKNDKKSNKTQQNSKIS